MPDRVKNILDLLSHLSRDATSLLQILAFSERSVTVKSMLNLIEDLIADSAFYEDDPYAVHWSRLLCYETFGENWPEIKVVIEVRLRKLCHYDIPKACSYVSELLRHLEDLFGDL